MSWPLKASTVCQTQTAVRSACVVLLDELFYVIAMKKSVVVAH